MGWFNYYGLIIMVLIMIPNIIFSIKCKDGFVNLYQNKTILVLENISRYFCFFTMVINIPYTYFGFIENGFLIYLSINSILLIIYTLGFIFCFSKHIIFRSYLLSIVPSLIFLVSGIVLRSILLILFLIIFLITHVTISVKNAYLKQEKDGEIKW